MKTLAILSLLGVVACGRRHHHKKHCEPPECETVSDSDNLVTGWDVKKLVREEVEAMVRIHIEDVRGPKGPRGAQGKIGEGGEICSLRTTECHRKSPSVKISGKQRTYLSISMMKASFFDAYLMCIRNQYRGLAEPRSVTDYEELNEFMGNYQYSGPIWTSGMNSGPTRGYAWLSDGEPFLYVNWDAGKPCTECDGQLGITFSNSTFSDTGFIRDEDHTTKFQFVCENYE